MPSKRWRSMPRLRWASSPTSATGKKTLTAANANGSRRTPRRVCRLKRHRVLRASSACFAVKAPFPFFCFGVRQMAFGDLCALADVKAWLQTGQNAFPDTDDALLTRLITAASQFIQSWLNRRIAPGDWQEVRDGTGGQRLAFANFPVTAVLSLSIDGLVIPPAPSDGGYGPGYVFTPTELALRGYVFT